MRSKYLIALWIVAALVILPPCIAQICGVAPQSLLFFALVQILLLLGYFFTVPVSLGFSIAAAVKKDWKKAGLYFAGCLCPLLTAWLATVTNRSGWEAVMSV
jgi:hypothetical protein